MPVNIEKIRIDGSFAIFENVQPPGIVAAHHSHVIGHNVEDQPHVVFMESSYEPVEVFGASDFRVQRIVIDNVVTVHAAGTGFQQRRNIEMTDAKLGKVGHDRGSLREREVAIELQAISREREVGTLLHDSRNHTTDQGSSMTRLRSLPVTPSLL